MKLRSLCLAVVVLGGASLVPLARAQATEAAVPAPAKSPADLDCAAAQALWRAETPAGIEPRSKEGRRFRDARMQEYVAAGRAFGAKYPDDPRRYDFYVQSSFTRPAFISGFKPEFDADPSEKNVIVDQAALDAFRGEQTKFLAQVIEAPDASPRHRGGAFYALLVDTRAAARDHGETFDVEKFRPLVERVAAKFPDERALAVVEQYVAALREKSPAAADAFTATLQDKPTLVAAMNAADDKRRAAEEATAKKRVEIASIKFTAADGREVDIAKLKGKVVLVDFWATWCGPCKAEIPNVVAAYNKYHDKGFEVIGITLENSGVTPQDDAATKEAKLAKAKRTMLEFAAKAGMPWPQYFDGLHWKNPYRDRFGIEGIPAMFLLDQAGRIVSTEARGPKLEAELKRLLGS